MIHQFFSTLPEAILWIFTTILTIFVNELMGRPVQRLLHRLTTKELPEERMSGFVLGLRETNVCIIDGNGADVFQPEDIVCKIEDSVLKIPDIVAKDIERVEKEESEKIKNNLPHAWDGEMAHIMSFSPSRTKNKESKKLLITLQSSRYYHFMAANSAIEKEFKDLQYESPARRRLIGEFDKWRTDVPPNVVNGLPLNLFILTVDNILVFSKRSSKVSIAPNEISFAVSENFHLVYDRVGSRLDVNILIKRALEEEIGWVDDSQTSKIAQTFILGFGIHKGYVGYGLFGYTRLPLTYKELQLKYSMFAKDKLETTEFLHTQLYIEDICKFIHKHDIYNFVGVAAVFVMLHENIKFSAINKRFLSMQQN